jgi:hypothetical protein
MIAVRVRWRSSVILWHGEEEEEEEEAEETEEEATSSRMQFVQPSSEAGGLAKLLGIL